MPIQLNAATQNPYLDYLFRRLSANGVDGSLAGQRVMRHVLANTADSAAIANTVSETNFSLNASISTSMFSPGRIFHLIASGVYSTTATPTLTFRVKFSSTNLVVFTARTGINNASNQSFKIEADIFCRTTGSSGTVMAQGTLFINTSAGVDTIETVVNNATTTIDTTAVQTLQVSLVWSAASSSNTSTLKNFYAFLSDYA